MAGSGDPRRCTRAGCGERGAPPRACAARGSGLCAPPEREPPLPTPWAGGACRDCAVGEEVELGPGVTAVVGAASVEPAAGADGGGDLFAHVKRDQIADELPPAGGEGDGLTGDTERPGSAAEEEDEGVEETDNEDAAGEERDGAFLTSGATESFGRGLPRSLSLPGGGARGGAEAVFVWLGGCALWKAAAVLRRSLTTSQVEVDGTAAALRALSFSSLSLFSSSLSSLLASTGASFRSSTSCALAALDSSEAEAAGAEAELVEKTGGRG